MRKFFISLTRNPLSLVGSAITTASAVLFFSLFSIELFGFLGNPYIGIIAFLVLPAIFVFGLLLIPLGIIRDRRMRRRTRKPGEGSRGFPVIDLNRPRTRSWALAFVGLTSVNLVILATATYKGVETMETTEFCGTTCHSVMEPEFTAYKRSPHSRVHCVDCHIGPGADWFVKSKLSGAWQVISATFDLYPHPIPTPVHDLRPARETCEQCHWPTKFVGDSFRVKTHYADDEINTPLKTVMLLRVGGKQGARSQGIHWHVDPDIRIRYRSDETRETMYEVEFTGDDGSVRTYRNPAHSGSDAEGSEEFEWRTMDCVDCHNRPSHIYRMPEQEVDAAIESGLISRDLPFIRRESVRVLQAEYDSHEAARAGIAEAIRAYYRENHPDVAEAKADRIEEAAEHLGEFYCSNVFPDMKVTWGTYPDHIGHSTSDGCFRCHNDEHVTDAGDVISQDCSTCHSLLALEEEDPEILTMLSE